MAPVIWVSLMTSPPMLHMPVLTGATSAELTPWFDEYQEEFLRLMSFGEHETFDHPVACEP